MTTKTAQFTPGPWVAKGFTIWGPSKEKTVSGAKVHRIVANTMTGSQDNADNANAALIAAAPAMYEVLKRIKVLMESGDIEGRDWVEYGHIINALAQAEGR